MLILVSWSTNVKSNLYYYKAAQATFNANPEGGVFILTSSTAVCRPRQKKKRRFFFFFPRIGKRENETLIQSVHIQGVSASGSSLPYSVTKAAGKKIACILIFNSRSTTDVLRYRATSHEMPGAKSGLESEGECRPAGTYAHRMGKSSGH